MATHPDLSNEPLQLSILHRHDRWYLPPFIIIHAVLLTAWLRYIAPEIPRVGSAWITYLIHLVLMSLLLIAPVFIYLIDLDRVNPLTFLKLTTPLDRGGLPFAVGIFVIVDLLSWADIILSFQNSESYSHYLLANFETLPYLLTILIAPLTEEIFCRGFLLQKLKKFWGFHRANILNGILFALYHWPDRFHGMSSDLLFDTFDKFIFGCAMGYMLQKSNSLWLCIGAHLLHNGLVYVIIYLF